MKGTRLPVASDQREMQRSPADEVKTREGRRTAAYIVCVLLICIPALSPLLVDSLTCGYDNVFHLWRAVQVERLMQQGVVFSRWAPDMAHGFGFPLFVFVSPASAYIAAVFHQTGLSWSLALNATFALGIVLGGVFAFLLARDLFGPTPGLVATAAYVYAPYQAYEVFNRGSLWEAFAWAFPPLVLWGLHRWVTRRDRRFLVLGAVGLCSLVLTHQLFAFLFAPLFGAWIVAAAIARRDRGALFRGAALGLLGLGLSAFFWLPGLVERGWVQTGRLLGTWVFDYRTNFLTIEELLSLPRAADPALVNDWPPKAIGIVPALLALLPVARWRWMDRAARWQAAVLLVLLGSFGCMTLSLSNALWDLLPLLEYIQFPWRFLGPAVLCVALLVAAGLSRVSGPAPQLVLHLQGLGPALAIPLLALSTLGWFYPRHCNPPRDTTVSGLIAWERQTDTLGTTAKGEYLPVWVGRFPTEPQMDTAYASGGTVTRLDSESLPEGTRVLAADYGATKAAIDLDTPSAFRARYLAFYYPGWRATIDGEPVPVTPTVPEGLISFDVPAGSHSILVAFRDTPVRVTGNTISILALAAVAVIVTLPLPMKRGSGDRRNKLHPGDSPTARSEPWTALLVCILIAAVKIGVVDQMDTPLRRSRFVDGRLEGVDVATEIILGDEFVLLGHDALPSSAASGGRFEVTTYWQALAPGGPDYGVTVNVVDTEGRRWSGADIRPPRWHRVPPPAGEWPADQYASVSLSVPLLAGTPPGEYTVQAIAFDSKTLLPLTAYGSDGRALGPAADLGSIRVGRPHRAADVGKMDLPGQLGARMGPLTLLDAHLDRAEAIPGDPVLLSLLWVVGERPGSDLGMLLTLRAPDGAVAASQRLAPTVTWHPTSDWREGDVWLGQHYLRLPGGLDSGAHQWALQLCTSEPGECTAFDPEVVVGTLTVRAPERIWAPPQMDIMTDAGLGGVVTLLGATLRPAAGPLAPGTTLTVTLVWRADADIDESYRVYLHLLGPDGNVEAQSDGEPVQWTRPTTGWAVGEVVLDEREINVPASAPPGEYVLRAGLYTIEAGRLLAQDGDDGVTLVRLSAGGES